MKLKVNSKHLNQNNFFNFEGNSPRKYYNMKVKFELFNNYENISIEIKEENKISVKC